MSSEDYIPVDCAFHSELELLAMRRSRVLLLWNTESGQQQQAQGRVADLYAREGAEYIQFEDGQRSLEVRLDRVVGFEVL